MIQIKITRVCFFLFACLSVALSGCYKLQKDYNREPHTVDPHINVSAWQYLKDRSTGNNPDTLFKVMYNAIIYSGIDTNEYIQPNRTFIFMNNTAAKAVWTNVKTAANVAGKRWEDYPKAAVKSYLQYLILDKVYDHYTLPAVTNVRAQTLAPAGTFTTTPTGFVIPSFIPNPNSTMDVFVVNSSYNNSNSVDYPVRLNDAVNVYTSSILATNGSIHVINNFLSTNLPQ